MRKWLTFFIITLALAIPSLAAAQAETPRLSSLDVQLWPEYDQPSMLVIYNFRVAESASLPANISFHIPADARINAVATMKNGQLVNSDYEAPVAQGEWQLLKVIVDTPTAYSIEYYQPLSVAGTSRRFSFLWFGDYAVDSFSVSVQQPVDATGMTVDPAFESKQETDGLTYFNSPVIALEPQEQYSLNLQYEKSTDRLTVPSSVVQPSAPLGENTSGHISLNNYVPYLLGTLGVILIVGGLGYHFLWRRPRAAPTRRRRTRASVPLEAESDVYCPQCGQRARVGDRFCRVCGTRLRQSAES